MLSLNQTVTVQDFILEKSTSILGTDQHEGTGAAVGTGPVRFWEPLAGDRSGPIRFWDTRIGTGPVRSGFETTEDRSGPVTGPVRFW